MKKIPIKYLRLPAVLTGLTLIAIALSPSAGISSPKHHAKDHASMGTESVATDQGLRVAFSIEAADDGDNGTGPIREGGHAQVLFRVTDDKTGAPISSLELAAWISQTDAKAEEESCEERIKRYVQGLLGLHADIDLNKYFILVMNNDRTISVIDPIMGVSGITHLFDMIALPERGEDWTASPDGKHLFVTMPRAGIVAKVDLNTFEVIENLAAGTAPVRVAVQPGGRYLWVGNDGRGPTGVTVIDLQSSQTAGFIETGAGHHEIAFSDDGLFAFVTNSQQNTVSVIDTRSRDKVKDLPTGENPIAVVFSEMSRAAYVLAEGDGAVTIVDGTEHEVTHTIRTDPGPIALRFDHHGRWGFAANFRQNRVDIIDAQKGEVAYRIPVGKQPHQIAFTHMYAYVRHLGTPDVTLIKMADLGKEGLPEHHKVAFGNEAPGQYRYTSLADSLSPTGHMAAIIGANPAEKVLFHYMEGMMVPMGSYSTYGRIPRAVRVVDRSVHEIAEGVYAAKIRVPESGTYNVSLLVKSPRVMNCFTFEAEPETLSASQDRKPPALKVEYVDPQRNVAVGKPFTVQFQLRRQAGSEPVTGLDDVMVTATRMPGNRPHRQIATHVGEGRYQVQLTVDQPGAYYLFISVPSLKVDSAKTPYLVLRATDSG